MKKSATYLAIGDSTVWTGTTTGAGLYSARLKASIEAAYGPIQLINKGIGGIGSSTLLANKTWWGCVPADLITIGVGMNDAANDGTTTAVFTTDLTAIVTYLKKRNPSAIIILCAPNRTTEATRTPYIAAYRTAMQAVATAQGVGYCDFSLAWSAGQDATYLPDGIHPSASGHALLHGVLWPIVQAQAAALLARLAA